MTLRAPDTPPKRFGPTSQAICVDTAIILSGLGGISSLLFIPRGPRSSPHTAEEKASPTGASKIGDPPAILRRATASPCYLLLCRQGETHGSNGVDPGGTRSKSTNSNLVECREGSAMEGPAKP